MLSSDRLVQAARRLQRDPVPGRARRAPAGRDRRQLGQPRPGCRPSRVVGRRVGADPDPRGRQPRQGGPTRALGAEVIQEGITFANREQRLREVMAERGYVLVHPFDDWDVIHGQGTVARELLDDEPGLEVIAASLGGGGLLAGTAISAKNHSATVKVVGVEPEAADDAYRTWKAGSIQTLAASPKTLADGVRTTAIGGRNFEVMFVNRLVDEVVTVSEDEIATAVQVAWSRLHLALEPTGALPLAAYLSGKLPKGRIGLILSGGNANLQTVATLLGTH